MQAAAKSSQPAPKACRICNGPILGPRLLRDALTCSHPCRRRLKAARYRELNGTSNHAAIPRSSIGAASELRAAADLLLRGYPAFRAVSPACPCDLVILLGKRAVRVEVRSATTSTTGATQFAHNDARDAGKYDVLALVFG